jgi:hypothetical protein
LSGTVIIVEGKGKLLQVTEKVPPHIRLKVYPHGMSPVGDKIGKGHTEQVHDTHSGDHDKKELIHPIGEEAFYGILGHHGESQVHSGNEGRGKHISYEKFPVGPVIGSENPQGRFFY